MEVWPHEPLIADIRPNCEQDLYDEHEERARRIEALQRAESEFDPVPFDVEAARVYGRVTAAVVAAGRKRRRRIADLMIAAIAVAEDLPLFTTNPGDYTGLEKLIRIVPVTRPPWPRSPGSRFTWTPECRKISHRISHVALASAGQRSQDIR